MEGADSGLNVMEKLRNFLQGDTLVNKLKSPQLGLTDLKESIRKIYIEVIRKYSEIKQTQFMWKCIKITFI